MLKRAFILCLIVLTGIVFTGQSSYAHKIEPSWFTFNAAKKTVEFGIIAAFNGNNGSWNNNGYYGGGMTVFVPLGWTVKIDFENPDGAYPHSLLITEPYEEAEFPREAGRDQVAISRAYTRSPDTGCVMCKETIRFKVKKTGSFYLFCGVIGHGIAGMWNRIVISAELEAPYIDIADGALALHDQTPYE